ncbi:hypothetical protein E2C01_036100 [Portunus trituberculatus]|uniref:Uncharacterized protein n=1 Tax=Portunus trituberculatus TaxID=210409 RepID=A0A5B7FBJ3_PORTR|nr:hypothetical protein [Portunus trituberculatus]
MKIDRNEIETLQGNHRYIRTPVHSEQQGEGHESLESSVEMEARNMVYFPPNELIRGGERTQEAEAKINAT